MLFSIYSFFQIGFNLEDFKRNLANRKIVTDPLFDPSWQWAFENASEALLETIQIAILASILGCFIALPLSFYASRATNQTTLTYYLYKSGKYEEAYAHCDYIIPKDWKNACLSWLRTREERRNNHAEKGE